MVLTDLPIPPSLTAAHPGKIKIWEGFRNFAGFVDNKNGQWPLSYLELSHPTGKYIRKMGVWIINMLLKKHDILMVGNTCAPGLFFTEIEEIKGIEQFSPIKECGVLVVNVLNENKKIFDIKKRVIFEAEPFMVLDVEEEWKSIEDYFGAMQSKYRIRAKKVYKVSENIEVQQYSGEQINLSILKTCAKLLEITLRKKTIAMSSDLLSILINYQNSFGPNFYLILYKKENEIVGFITWIKLGKTINAIHVGFNETAAENNSIYQRILYDLIAIGIENKINKINFGRTATEIKSTLGAKPVLNNFNVYIQNPILFYCTKLFRKYFFKKVEYVIRNPFK